MGGGPFLSSGVFDGLSAGTYTVTIRDEAMDQYSIVFDIVQPDPLTV